MSPWHTSSLAVGSRVRITPKSWPTIVHERYRDALFLRLLPLPQHRNLPTLVLHSKHVSPKRLAFPRSRKHRRLQHRRCHHANTGASEFADFEPNLRLLSRHADATCASHSSSAART